MRRQAGFTLIELMIVIGVIAIASTFAIPNFNSWLNKYRLRSAADELYNSMQLARLSAVRENTSCTVTASASPDRYVVATTDGKTIKTVSLSTYGGGVTFVHPEGATAIPASPIQFNSNGLRNPPSSYIYLSNRTNSEYWRVGAMASGVIKLQRRKGNDWI